MRAAVTIVLLVNCMLCSAGTNKNTSPSPQEIAANALSGKDLFGDASPIGEYIQVGNVRFRVKGILERKGVSPM